MSIRISSNQVINAGVVMVEVPFMPFEPTEALFKAAGIPYAIWGARELAEAIPGFDTGKYWPPKQTCLSTICVN